VLWITSPKDPASSRGIVLWIPKTEDRTSWGRVAVVFRAGGGFAVFVVFVFVAVVGVMGVGMGDFGGTVKPAHFEDGA
jgi:hypothetical protein